MTSLIKFRFCIRNRVYNLVSLPLAHSIPFQLEVPLQNEKIHVLELCRFRNKKVTMSQKTNRKFSVSKCLLFEKAKE